LQAKVDKQLMRTYSCETASKRQRYDDVSRDGYVPRVILAVWSRRVGLCNQIYTCFCQYHDNDDYNDDDGSNHTYAMRLFFTKTI